MSALNDFNNLRGTQNKCRSHHSLMKSSRGGWEGISPAVVESDRRWEADSVTVITLQIYYHVHVESLLGSLHYLCV